VYTNEDAPGVPEMTNVNPVYPDVLSAPSKLTDLIFHV
jgi:hypothetical protein